MKWTNLKIKNLPIIALEVERVVDIFNNLHEKVRRENRKEDLRELMKLREEVQRRIDSLDYFYQRQYMDENIAIFHMLSLKLQRALSANRQNAHKEPNQNETEYLSMINEHEEGNQSLHLQNQIMMLEQPLFAYYDQQKSKEKPASKNAKIHSESSKEKSKPNLKKNAIASSKKIKEDKMQKEKQHDRDRGSDYFTFDANNIVANKVSVDQKLNGLTAKGPALIKAEELKKEEMKAKEEMKYSQSQQINSRNSYANKPKANEMKKTADSTLKRKADQWIGFSQSGATTSKKQQTATQRIKTEPENPNQLKFTIKMSKQEYQSLLEMKNKLKSQGKL